MENNWEPRNLGDVVEIKTGKLNSNHATELGRYPFFTCAPNPLRIDNYAFDTEAILLAGNNANGIFHLNIYKGKFNAYQRTYVLTIKDENRANLKFLYYSLRTVTQNLGTYSLGTATKFLTMKILSPLAIPLPPLEEQKAIAHVLGALDDKIELNRQMNATLEGMAQALFKSWFVDFDPVLDNALAADNPIPDELEERAETRRQALANGAANREAAKLFPATFHLTEDLGWIPTGWEVSNLKDSTNKIGSGATPRGGSSAYIDEGTRLVRSQNIYDSSFRWPGIVCITDEAAEKLKNVTLTERDVLINITGDSILRTCVVDPAVLPARVNQHVAILRPNVNIPTHYLHQYIVRPEYKTYLRGFDAGGSRSAITKGNLQEAEILIPPDNVLQTFSAIIESFFERKDKNNLEIRSLAKLRDTLLPKLISGELRIPDAEKLAAEALA